MENKLYIAKLGVGSIFIQHLGHLFSLFLPKGSQFGLLLIGLKNAEGPLFGPLLLHLWRLGPLTPYLFFQILINLKIRRAVLETFELYN